MTSRLLSIVAIITVLLGSTILHGHSIETLPQGLFLDEYSIGLNSGTIATEGIDEHGESMPLYFKAFGEYKNPLYIYSAAGLFQLFGISDGVLRLTSLLYFLLAQASLMALAYLRKRNLWEAVIMGVIVTFLPALFTISRVSFEVISHVGIIALWLAIIAAVGSRTTKQDMGSMALWATAGLVLGLSVYSYSTARMLTPLFFLGSGAFLLMRKEWKNLAWYYGCGLLVSLPFIHLFFTTPDILFTRFDSLAVTGDNQVLNILGNYLSYFSPDFLLLAGDPNLRHHSGFGGMLGWALLLCLIAGLWVSLKPRTSKKSPENRDIPLLMLMILLLTPIGAALTEPHHYLRVAILAIPWVYFAYRGIITLLKQPPELRTILVPSLVLLYAIEVISYQVHWHRDYPAATLASFATFGITEALEEGRKQGYITYTLSERILKAETLMRYERLVFPDLSITVKPEHEVMKERSGCTLFPIRAGVRPDTTDGVYVIPFPPSSTIIGWCYDKGRTT